MEFKLHEVEWNNEKVERFWDFFSQNKNLRYFAQDVGDKVIYETKKYIPVTGNILDYGCGKGHLIGFLLQNPSVKVTGADFSNESVKTVKETFKGSPQFDNCLHVSSLPSQLPSNHFDVVFFLETIEHLTEEHYLPTLKELHRVVKEGGYVVITTRNNENLDSLKVICPDCGCIFHRVQHMNSFTPESISALLSKNAFETRISKGLNFYYVSPLKRFYKAVIAKLKRTELEKPNLLYIGKKSSQQSTV